MTSQQAAIASLRETVQPLMTREIAGIAAIDAALAHESAADYVVMFQGAKNGKQANVEQLTTLLRMQGGIPDERGGIRKVLTMTQAAVSSRVSTIATLRAMQLAEAALVKLYSAALDEASDLAERAFRKALGRAMVHAHLLTAHIAKRSGTEADAKVLPAPLLDYFAGADARACMRCHLDRPGRAGALERRNPHPYTYICAACHDEVLGEFPTDLASQMDRWPSAVREAKVLQHAIGRVSKLNAIGRVLYPLAGLPPEVPVPAAERAVIVPAMTPTPGPAQGERAGTIDIEIPNGLEADYIRNLFSAREVWRNW
ncbi:MAG TPA: hypothetical protein VL173_00245 [Vicinamibacterales bacterium]|jgi:hypothetical protein|nr:hypothetical protein [Vicinamibacterales bacterium]